MKPIECPECHSENWHIIETPLGNRTRETMSVIREDTIPMVQSDFPIVKSRCGDCDSYFWVIETQAKIIMEEFA
jgi:hypothetical protein